MNIPTEFISEDQYLVREPEAEYKSEYRQGRMVAMSGASRAHGRIASNIHGEFHGLLKGTPCQAFTSDTRVRVAAARFYTYPDVSVVCGTPVFDDPKRGTLLNPTLLVEVLSPATEAYDRGEKFGHYKRLDSLREYVLVRQDRVCVEIFRRGVGNQWEGGIHTHANDIVSFSSVGVHMPLRDIYDRVSFPP